MKWTMSGLSRQALLLAAARAAGQLIMVAVQAMLARAVGVERFGAFAGALALAVVLSGLIDFGAGSYWVREYSAGRLPAEEFRKRSSGKMLIGVFGSSILVLVGAWGIWRDLLFQAAGLLMATVVYQTSQVSLVAARRNSLLSLLVLLERLILGGTFLILVVYSPLMPEFSLSAAYLLSGVSLAVAAGLLVPDLRPDTRNMAWRRTWKGARYYGISTVLVSLQSTDVLIGGAAGGPAIAGAYGAVSRWIMPISLATQSFTSLLNPVISSAKNRDEAWRLMRKSLWLPGLSFLAAALMAVLADPLVLLVLGSGFSESSTVLRLMAFAAAMSSISQVAATVLQARRRERIVAGGLTTAVVAQLLLVAPLVHRLGAIGLAVAFVVAQALLLGVLVVATLGLLKARK